jgi:hypothetical protein
MEQGASNERPYRSHLRPACIPCRKRKSRCQSEASSSCCLMCRAHRTDCIFPTEPRSSSQTPLRRRQARLSTARNPRQISLAPGPPAVSISGNSTIEQPVSVVESALNSVPTSSSRNTTSHENQASNVSPAVPTSTEWAQQNAQSEESPLALGSNDEQPHNLHIVGPAVTSDNQVLSDYLSSMPSASRGSRIIRPAIGNRSRPVLFTAVQKRPVGLDSNLTFAEERLQLIEKILEPFTSDLVDV